MTETNRTTYSDDHDTGYFDSAARGSAGAGTQSQAGGGASAAERLGGPSESESSTGTDEHTAAGEPAAADDAKPVGNGAGGTASGAGGGSGAGGDVPARLIDRDRAESYQARWKEIKGDFVDEPKRAVRGANELVGEVLDQLEELFRNQRTEIEKGLDNDDTTTEDLRLALGKYRSFFDRLLSI